MIQIAIEDVKDRNMLAYMSDDDKSDFIVYRVYKCVDSNHDMRSYPAPLKVAVLDSDFSTLEEDILIGYPLLWKEYVRRVSAAVSTLAYSKYKDVGKADSTEVACTFYYGLMRCSFKNKVEAMLEAIMFIIHNEASNEDVE
jgi:hypothetical protein